MSSNLILNNNNSFNIDDHSYNFNDSINNLSLSSCSYPFLDTNEFPFGSENIRYTNMDTQNNPKIDLVVDNIIDENNLKNNTNLLKRKRGRRTKEEKEKNTENNQIYHDKYRKDNILRKIKHICIESCFNFVNDILNKTYNKHSSKLQRKFEFQLIKLNHELVKDIKVDFNRFIAKQTIKWILTNNKCTKFKNYEDNHNQILIEKILLDCTEQDRIKLELLLNMTFLDYLDLYCGKKVEDKDIFDSLITFEQYCNDDNFKKKNPDHEQYKNCLKEYLFNYENNLITTKERKPRKKRDYYTGNTDIKKNKEFIPKENF